MSAKTIDLSASSYEISELLEQVAGGTEILLVEGSIPRARLVPVLPRVERRVPGLHAGSITIQPDFDEPLPDDFWAA